MFTDAITEDLLVLVIGDLADGGVINVVRVHELELLVLVVVPGLVLLHPVDIGSSRCQPKDVPTNKGNSACHDDEKRLKGFVVLQTLQCHALQEKHKQFLNCL
jgi:hypothetical protein